jgi:hypothetical protein
MIESNLVSAKAAGKANSLAELDFHSFIFGGFIFTLNVHVVSARCHGDNSARLPQSLRRLLPQLVRASAWSIRCLRA